MGAGFGICQTDPKDESVFTGDVDDSDTCIQAVGRVHQSRHLQPIDNVQEKGDPVDAPDGPFLEVGYRDLGEISFDGLYRVEDVQIEDTGTIEAFDVKSGRRLWRMDKVATSLRSANGVVFMVLREGPDKFEERFPYRYGVAPVDPTDKRSGHSIAAVDLKTGKQLWSVNAANTSIIRANNFF